MNTRANTSDPLVLRILIEKFEREAHLRTLWNRRHQDFVQEAAKLKRPAKNFDETDIYAYDITSGMSTLTKDHIHAYRYKIKKSQKEGTLSKHIRGDNLGLGDKDLSSDPLMRPVNGNVKEILYDSQQCSRTRYLKERLKASPEEKYYYPETNSWDYGWRLNDSKMKIGPRYYRTVNEELFWVVGGSAAGVLAWAGLGALLINFVTRQKTEKPLVPFDDQSLIVPGPEKARVSKLYMNAINGAILEYDSEDVRTLYESIRNGLKESNNGNCLGWREGPSKPYVWLSYKDTLIRAQNFGSGLLNLGLTTGQNTFLGIYLKNCLEWVIAEQAAYCYSMVVVPLNDNADSEACSYVINQTKVSAVVCENDERANVLLDGLPQQCVRVLITINDVLPATFLKAKLKGVLVLKFKDVEIIGAQKNHPCLPPKPSDLCTVCYTSGTTGLPKGVMLTHANVITCICGVAVHLGQHKLTSKDVTISFLPMSHMLDRYFQHCLYMVGGAVGFYSGDMKFLSQDFKALRPTVMPAVPRLLNRMYHKAQADISHSTIRKFLFNMALLAKQYDLKRGIIRGNTIWDKLVFHKVRESVGGRLRYMFVSSAPLAGNVLTFVRCALSCQIVESYGQTECAASMATTIWGEYIPDHVGPPIPSCKIKLVDAPNMDYYSNNNQGEICVKGANVFKGYFKDPERTKEALDEDGWLHTGDIGEWQPNGTLKIIDRKKHIFKLSQGEYVAPEKIQNIYLRSKYVEQVFVYGESLKSCLIAIVIPVAEVIKNWAASHGIEGSIEELCENKRIKELILEDMSKCGKTARLRKFEQVKDIFLYPESLTSQSGLLTPTMKSKRPEIKNFFKEKLDYMYRSLD